LNALADASQGGYGWNPPQDTQPAALAPATLTQSAPPKRNGWDILAKTSLTGMTVVNGGLFLSPYLAKALAKPSVQRNIKTAIGNRLGEKWGTKVEQWAKQNSNYDTIKANFTRAASFAGLLQLNTGYQVGINTQQPSKSLSSLTGTMTQALTCLKVEIPYFQTLTYLSSFFWFSGETNDIKNTNNPGQRREFDQNRLFRAFKGEQRADEKGFFRELWNTLKFMGKDFRYTLSNGPWKNLQEAIKNKEDLKKPQPYQTAIGAQLNLLAFIAASAAFWAQKREIRNNPQLKLSNFSKWPAEFKKIPQRFSRLSQFVMVFSIISYLPVLMRALQSKGEVDGALTFLGVPMITASQVLKGTLDIKHWQGLLSMGSPIVNEGKRINSKKYRAQVNYLTALQQEALRNPNLQATDILYRLESSPQQLKAMADTMGQFRVDYILNLLRAGAIKQQTEHVTLATYLQPLLTLGA
jgi:hypothetical protein